MIIQGELHFEPDGFSGSLCHQGAGGHVHDEQFMLWWERFGEDITRLGPPTDFRWTSEDPVAVPYWTHE